MPAATHPELSRLYRRLLDYYAEPTAASLAVVDNAGAGFADTEQLLAGTRLRSVSGPADLVLAVEDRGLWSPDGSGNLSGLDLAPGSAAVFRGQGPAVRILEARLTALMERCEPGGLLFWDLPGDAPLGGIVSKLRQASHAEDRFELEEVLYHGLGVRLLSPWRWLSPGNLTHAGLLRKAWYGLVENHVQPFVRFIAGDRVLLILRRSERLSAGPHEPDQLKSGQAEQTDAAFRPELSIIVPAYNEALRIEQGLAPLEAYFAARRPRINYELLVVDDGSQDDTARFVRERFPGARIVSLYRNCGKGAAVAAGVAVARGELLLVVDADGATEPAGFEALRSALESASGRDLAIGSRYLPTARIATRRSLWRRGLSRGGNLLIQALLGLPYRDTQCGFKLYRRPAALALFRRLRNNGYAYEFEVLERARQFGFAVSEVPVRWSDRVGSKLTTRAALRTLRDLLEYRFRYLLRFSVVGVCNTVVDYGLHNFLGVVFGRGDTLRQTAYQAAAFLCANLFSFVCNSGFTFRQRAAYGRFLFVSLFTLSLVTLSFYGLNRLWNPDNLLWLTNVLKLSTVLISLIMNYLGYKLLVFRVA